jgi:hypothetical protein
MMLYKSEWVNEIGRCVSGRPLVATALMRDDCRRVARRAAGRNEARSLGDPADRLGSDPVVFLEQRSVSWRTHP